MNEEFTNEETESGAELETESGAELETESGAELETESGAELETESGAELELARISLSIDEDVVKSLNFEYCLDSIRINDDLRFQLINVSSEEFIVDFIVWITKILRAQAIVRKYNLTEIKLPRLCMVKITSDNFTVLSVSEMQECTNSKDGARYYLLYEEFDYDSDKRVQRKLFKERNSEALSQLKTFICKTGANDIGKILKDGKIGMASIYSDDYKKGLEKYEEMIQDRFRVPLAFYKEKGIITGLEPLNISLDNMFSDYRDMPIEPYLDSIEEEEEYKEIIKGQDNIKEEMEWYYNKKKEIETYVPIVKEKYPDVESLLNMLSNLIIDRINVGIAKNTGDMFIEDRRKIDVYIGDDIQGLAPGYAWYVRHEGTSLGNIVLSKLQELGAIYSVKFDMSFCIVQL
jgi:hypothetical protein